MRLIFKYILVLLLANFCSRLVAQDFYPSQRPFDKTRIQYQNFVWHFFSSQNFEVYYFGKNENLARTTIKFAESDFLKITQLLSYTPFQKTKIFVYPSQSELLQSNSGISLNNPDEVENENLSKFRFEIVAVRILKKPSELSVGDGFACHSSPRAIKTFSSQATACCEP